METRQIRKVDECADAEAVYFLYAEAVDVLQAARAEKISPLYGFLVACLITAQVSQVANVCDVGGAGSDYALVFFVKLQEKVVARVGCFVERDVADSVGDFTAGYPTVFALVEMFGVGRGVDLYITVSLGPNFPFDNIA